MRLSLRRKRLKAGSDRSAPSSMVAGVERSVSAVTTVVANGTCSGGSAVRAALTTIVGSVTWAGAGRTKTRQAHRRHKRRKTGRDCGPVAGASRLATFLRDHASQFVLPKRPASHGYCGSPGRLRATATSAGVTGTVIGGPAKCRRT